MLKKIFATLILAYFSPSLLANTLQLYTHLEAVLPQAEQGDMQAQFNVGVIYDRGWNIEKDPQQALFWFQKAGEQGQPNAAYNVGAYYINGVLGSPDVIKAIPWLQKAAEGGHSYAQLLLSDIYLEGLYIAKDEQKVIYWRNKALENRSAEEQLQFALYLFTHPQFPDKEKAIYWLEKAHQQGNQEASLTLADIYFFEQYGKQDLNKAYQLYAELAEQGNAKAQLLYAEKYATGFSVAEDQLQACKWIKRSAEQGYALAQYSLGRCYIKGWLGESSPTKAFEWFLKAAEANISEAQVSVAHAYFRGNGVPKDESKGYYWLNKAEKVGDPEAQSALGARNIKQNLQNKSAVELLIKSAKQGNVDAKFNLGVYYHKQKNLNKAIYWLEQATRQGDVLSFAKLANIYPKKQRIQKLQQLARQSPPKIAFALGNMYNSSRFGQPKPKEMIKWYHFAAEKNEENAQLQLGLHYLFGNVVEKDINKAIHWLEKSAEQGNPQLQLELALRYSSAIDFPQNKERARYWLEKAVRKGDARAAYSLGIFYLYGIGGEADWDKAEYWLSFALEHHQEKAEAFLAYLHQIQQHPLSPYTNYDYRKLAKQGMPFAQTNLAVALHNQENWQEAQYWFTQAAEQGNSLAQTYLGLYALYGVTTAVDYQQAYFWLQKAANQQNADAQFVLGTIYQQGLGREIDLNQAEKWLSLAAQQQNPEAQKSLFNLYMQQNQLEKARQQLTALAQTGNVNAQLELGHIYRNTQFPFFDPKQSFYWYNQAAEQQNEAAQLIVATFYLQGFGVEKDIAKTQQIVTPLAQQGNHYAQYLLSYLLWNPTQKTQALELLMQSAKQGNQLAQNTLGSLYLLGEQVPQSYGQAYYWLQLAAEQNDAYALLVLGLMNLEGLGIPKDLTLAKTLLLKSAQQGNPTAQFIYATKLLEDQPHFTQAIMWLKKAAQQNFELAQVTLALLEQHKDTSQTQSPNELLQQPLTSVTQPPSSLNNEIKFDLQKPILKSEYTDQK